jgi:t-SNARE complex subunit (syntaxin)
MLEGKPATPAGGWEQHVYHELRKMHEDQDHQLRILSSEVKDLHQAIEKLETTIDHGVRDLLDALARLTIIQVPQVRVADTPAHEPR